MQKKYLVISLLLITCLAFSFPKISISLDEASQKSKQLQDMKKSVEKIKKEKKAVIQKERSILTELKKIDVQLDNKEKELNVQQRNLEQSEKDLKVVVNNLTTAQRNLEKTQMMLNKRLRAMYMLGYQDQRLNYLKLLISSDNVSDATHRYKYVSSIATADKNLLDRAIAQKEEYTYRKKLVENKKQEIFTTKINTEKAKDEIINKKQTRSQILAKVQRSKKELTKAQVEIESSINKLERLIAQLKSNQDKQDKNDTKIAKNLNKQPYKDSSGGLGGSLLWPVSGDIVENAAPSMKGVTIKANKGTDIKCVDDGIVDYARWFDGVGYGQMVIINHGNGFRTLYAHASDILVKEGQKVTKGQTIARVGDTGSLKGPELYFEVWRGSEAQPTRRWLK
ncbi:MAG: Peptidase protein [Candidatus Poribacteria bacterium]|nr:Peptidase protein [Candidatus Poribacteria bacterium]